MIAYACLLLALLTIQAPGAAVAEDITFDSPVDCSMGEVCSIQNYYDHDPGPDWRDYDCGFLSYDGHKGTDFRVVDIPAMRKGVAVLAAADGVVRATRDGMEDVDVRTIGREAIKGREAGNAVVVVHPGGYETQYSHLLKGSVAVRKGDRVSAGQRLGLIGMSGLAEFPHVEFVVRKDGQAVDPFTGFLDQEACGLVDEPLWSAAALSALPYAPTGLLGAGFAAGAPTMEELRKGGHRGTSLADRAEVMVFWARAWGVRQGDEERMTLLSPTGEVLAEHAGTLTKNQAQRLRYIGKKRPGNAWPAGEYIGRYILRRTQDGRTVDVLDATKRLLVSPSSRQR